MTFWASKMCHYNYQAVYFSKLTTVQRNARMGLNALAAQLQPPSLPSGKSTLPTFRAEYGFPLTTNTANSRTC